MKVNVNRVPQEICGDFVTMMIDMRKLKIIEHISLDGVVQTQAVRKTISHTATGLRRIARLPGYR